MDRRRFLRALTVPGVLSLGACRTRRALAPAARPRPDQPDRLLFVTQGRTAMMDEDGSDLRVLEFDIPNQATWQPAGFFEDGRRMLLLSMEPRRDGPGRPFEEFYTQTPTHLWIYDLESEALEEIGTRERLAVFYTPELILGNGRLLVQVVRNRVGQILSMNLDGTDAREFTRPGEGLPYGLSLSPDGRRVAFHLASPTGYQIWTSDVDGRDRQRIAGHPDHLYFGPRWSHDGAWIAYADCEYRNDPGHDWADVVASRADGTETRRLTEGQAMWFAATYGNPATRGGGSNVVSWTRHGAILFPCRAPGTKVAWEYQPSRPDTDHFNRDFKPDLARGGTSIGSVDPGRGTLERMGSAAAEPHVWDFRIGESPGGGRIAFCRARTGEVPALWVMNSDGTDARPIFTGLDGRGVDHPRWVPRRIGPM